MRIRWTDSAVRDFTQICDYINEHGTAATARRVALSIYNRIDILTKFPESGRTGRQPETRELVSAVCPTLLFTESAKMWSKFCASFTEQGLDVVQLMAMLFLHRNHAAVRHFADYVLELDGGVVNAEIAVQALFHVAQNALAD